MKIEKIVWDEETVEHISHHSVTPEEVEEALFNEEAIPVIMHGKEGKYLAYSKTTPGRLLFVVFVIRHRITRIVTARDMTGKEKQFYKRAKK